MSEYKNKFLSLWPQLQIGQSFWVVDALNNEEFWIVDVDDQAIEIRPQQQIKISRQAFMAVFDYLVNQAHYQDNPCEVKSGEAYEKSTPLSKVVQDANPYMKACVLPYVLAILKAMGLVEMSGHWINSVWLVDLEEKTLH